MTATISFRSLEVLRKVEFASEENKKYRRGLLPSRYALSKLCRDLEQYGSEILPFENSNNSIKFDIPQTVKWLLEQYGLWRYVANGEQVTVAATCDGGELAWKLIQVSAGIQLVDRRAADPLTGSLLFTESGRHKVQYRNVCFPLQVHLAKDNRNFYDLQLSGFFSQFNIMESELSAGLRFSHGADMSSLQKTVKRGGAMKNKIYGCYCCNIHRDDLVRPNLLPCHDCMVLEPENGPPCYHQEVADEQLFERLRVEKSEHEAVWPHLALLPLARSRVRFGEAGVNNSVHDPMHIEYRGTTISQRQQHHRLLETELSIRNIAEAGRSTEELRIQLHEILLVEASYMVLKKCWQQTTSMMLWSY